MARTGIDDRPLSSKKFIAYILAEFTWKILIALTLVYYRESMSMFLFGFLLSIVLVAGFVETGYILGQASLDKYVRVAEIATEANIDLKMKDLDLKSKKTPGEEV